MFSRGLGRRAVEHGRCCRAYGAVDPSPVRHAGRLASERVGWKRTWVVDVGIELWSKNSMFLAAPSNPSPTRTRGRRGAPLWLHRASARAMQHPVGHIFSLQFFGLPSFPVSPNPSNSQPGAPQLLWAGHGATGAPASCRRRDRDGQESVLSSLMPSEEESCPRSCAHWGRWGL